MKIVHILYIAGVTTVLWYKTNVSALKLYEDLDTYL